MTKYSLQIITLFILIIACSINILYSGIKSDEEVLFYPQYAYQSDEGKTIVNVHGLVYETEENSVLRKIIVNTIIKSVEIHNEGEAGLYLEKRIRYFLYDNESEKKLSIKFNGKIYELNKSSDNGHFTDSLTLNDFKKIPPVISFNAVINDNDSRDFSGKGFFIPRKGISVISDIDDTIKDSNVLNNKELIKNTFMRKFKHVKGMPELYKKFKTRGASFHYVSGSPWQLYVPLSEFCKEAGFPEGSFHMKYLRVKDSSFIDFITADQLSYKTKVIKSIINDFPERTFILIGDSGESDPEVYAAIASAYPGRIKAVFIRDVKKSGDSPERYSRLFGNIKDITFKLFTDPGKLY